VSRKLMLFCVTLLQCLSVIAQSENMQENVETVKPSVIAVVQDGNSMYFSDLLTQVKKELNVLLAGEKDVIFDEGAKYNADWDNARVATVLDQALNDPNVDVVYASGILMAYNALHKPVLNKPVISGLPEDPDTIGLPYDEQGHSTKKNFNFVVVPQRASQDLTAFHEMIPFKRLTIAVDSHLLEAIGEIAENVAEAEKAMKIKINIVPMNTTAADFLAHLDSDTEAIYLTPGNRMTLDEWKKLIAGINERKIPSFSMLGHRDVHLGVLAGQAPDMEARMARRIALNMEQILNGMPPESLQVNMSTDEKLLINAKTAEKIGYSPSLTIMMETQFVDGDIKASGKAITLAQSIEYALDQNTALEIQKASTRVSRYSRNGTATKLLPQVEGNAQYSRVDDDQATDSMGSIPREKTKVGVSATQIIYNDPLMTAYRASRKMYEGSLNKQEAVRLATINNVAQSYVQLLQALSLLKIEVDNLQLTKSNLELAKVRYQVGTSGPEEVNRWESSAASQKATVLSSQADVEQAMTALNQVMGTDQRTHWVPTDIRGEAGDVHFLDGRIDPYISNMQMLDVLGKYIINYGLHNSPTLQQLETNIEAQKMQLNQYKRRFIVPEIAASFEFNHTIDEEKLGASPDAPSSGADDDWMGVVKATLPLFESGGRVYDALEARAQLDEYQATYRQTAEYVEQQIRNAFSAVDSSFPSVQLQQEASVYAGKNLDVVQDKYARGVVSILDLLDAQNQAFVANQNAAIARFSYLKDIYDMQYAMSWFEEDKTDAQKDEWIAGLEQYMQHAGVQ